MPLHAVKSSYFWFYSDRFYWNDDLWYFIRNKIDSATIVNKRPNKILLIFCNDFYKFCYYVEYN